MDGRIPRVTIGFQLRQAMNQKKHIANSFPPFDAKIGASVRIYVKHSTFNADILKFLRIEVNVK